MQVYVNKIAVEIIPNGTVHQKVKQYLENKRI